MNEVDETLTLARRLGKKEMLLQVLEIAETDGKYWKLTDENIEELQAWAK